MASARVDGRTLQLMRLLLPPGKESPKTNVPAALAAWYSASDSYTFNHFRRVLTYHSRKRVPGQQLLHDPKSRGIRILFPRARKSAVARVGPAGDANTGPAVPP